MLAPRTVTIRPADPADQLSVIRLAALDSKVAPSGPLLLAEVDGELAAALSLHQDRVVADPFRRTSYLVDLLRLQAAELQASRRVTGIP